MGSVQPATGCGRFLPAACALAAWAVGAAWAPVAAEASGPAPYPRRDAPTIRREAQDILAQSRFQEHKTLSERIREWFAELFGGWRPDLLGLSGLGKALVWLLLGGCAVLLLVLLFFLARTVAQWFAGRGARPAPAAERAPLFEEAATCEELRRRIDALVRSGAFRQAAGLLVVLLVRTLQPKGVLRFHTSKTNGDYVREFPAAHVGREDFRQFVQAADFAVYGRTPCGREDYLHVMRLWREADHHAAG
jgi:hypothetical protein